MKNIISFFSNKVLNKNFVPILSLADSLKKRIICINSGKSYFVLFILMVILSVSCKKVDLLNPAYIHPPTQFPNIDDEKPEIPDYPDPTPVPTPPDE